MTAPLTVMPGGLSDPSDRLAELLAETSPEARLARVEAATRPAHPALAPVLPDGRLPRGAVVTVHNDMSLLLALTGGAVTRHDWVSIIGAPTVGLSAAAAYGIPLDRTVLVEEPGSAWAQVAAELATATPLMLLRRTSPAPPRQLRRLEAVLRETGTTLLTPDPWDGAVLTLSTSSPRIHGVGDGWGMVSHREVTVHCSGRGRARPRSLRLLLPGPDGTAQPLAPAAERTTQAVDAATA
ncbi:hypothetical protein ABTY61_23080 [Kitasatospora sp. NPDC096128]|uniref:hypothetical protein n=1 Tax=Kitasatospora sp. NPDC096128 TaxID=3155547 RepID=UPI0033221EAF